LVLVDFNDEAEFVSKGQINKLMGKKTDELYGDRPDVISDFNSCLKKKKQFEGLCITGFAQPASGNISTSRMCLCPRALI
jgi:hypothetical protein